MQEQAVDQISVPQYFERGEVMNLTSSKLPSNLNIIKESKMSRTFEADESLMPTWLDEPDSWNRDDFLEKTKSYLFKKNGVLDTADMQLVGMLASQIEIYVSSVKELKSSGLVINFNNGVTMGPNPHMTIADKALNRVVQIMKELELSPKSRSGYRSNYEMSPELKRFLEGP
jgi:P27 family predicted phage terminase small subunit